MAKTIADLRSDAVVASRMLQGLEDQLMDCSLQGGPHEFSTFLMVTNERVRSLWRDLSAWEDANGRRLEEAGFGDITNPSPSDREMEE